jgi:hypothetical protein
MAAEDVVTNMPTLSTPVLHSESEPDGDVLTGTPQFPTSTGEPEDDDPSLPGVFVLDSPRELLFSVTLEFRTADLPRWEPSMDFDQPRALSE